jgi:hypothetical protein
MFNDKNCTQRRNKTRAAACSGEKTYDKVCIMMMMMMMMMAV